MGRIVTAALMALLPALPALAGSPCEPLARRDTHQPGWTHGMRLSSMSELDLQRRCLLWEWSVEPKAEPIPPSRRMVIFDTRGLPPPFRGAPRTQAASEILDAGAEPPRLGLGLAPDAVR